MSENNKIYLNDIRDNEDFELIENIDEIEHKEIKSKEFRKQWKDFFALRNSEFKLYYFCSKPEKWRQGLGMEGYCWVENGFIIESITTRMN